MRTYFKTTELPKRLAKAIVHVFPALSLSTGQEWAAKVCGYRNWHELDMFSRNYSGELTPDPFLAEYIANDEGFGPMHDAPHVRAKSERIEYQNKVLDELMGNSAFAQADHYWRIMHYAHQGLSKLDRVQFGRGAPLFEALQFPWFELEDEAACAFEEGELEDKEDFTNEGFALMNGFSSHQQLNRWLKGATRLNDGEISELKEEFPEIFARVGGGSDIRLVKDANGRDVAVQSTRHRYWWQRDRDHRMLGGLSLTIRISGARDGSDDDEFEIGIHDAWYDAKAPKSLTEADFPMVPWAGVNESLERFLLTRVGMPSLHGQVRVSYDSELSRPLAEVLRDLVFDMAMDATKMDLGPILHREVVPYQPKYPRQRFFHLPSELV